MKRRVSDLYDNNIIIKLFKSYWDKYGNAHTIRILEYEINRIEDNDERNIYMALLDHTLYSEESVIVKFKSLNHFDKDSLNDILNEVESKYL